MNINKSQVTSYESRNKWYVIQTKPLSEDKVCLQFTKMSLRGSEATVAISGADSSVILSPLNEDEGSPVGNLETFCPKLKSISLSKGSEKINYKPLFPNYVFLRWDLSSASHHRLVKYTRGVNKILGDSEKPVPISDEVIELIKARTNAGGIIEQNTFKKGDLVKVKKGHLKDLMGVLDRPVSDSGRVAVLLNLFNRQMRVQMHCAEIARA
ncbi:MAG: hypothetical protein COX62_00480 [Deltaproteobacteria bacterium CG_4_10_14_0_2_um_filter_43_8]|nr:MAG: hypothetical protein COV46_08945 [Deltaproteobacteria bacterium CG11_big_fil_rev_8_21_14_0_20_49_13]PJA22205.1 MAG: hypothetical protein COX62_00480 [Deltaproteobacteria bacterium CG_4_10_14_0_2_um_filter_43_8]